MLEQVEKRVHKTYQRVVWHLRNLTRVVLIQPIHFESIDVQLRVGENLIDIGEREHGVILRDRVDVYSEFTHISQRYLYRIIGRYVHKMRKCIE